MGFNLYLGWDKAETDDDDDDLGMVLINMGCFDILLHDIKHNVVMVYFVRVYVSIRAWFLMLSYYYMVYVLILLYGANW